MTKNSITQSVILALATLTSAITWNWLRVFLFAEGNLLLPIIGFFIMCILLSLGWLLLKSKIVLATTLGIILLGYFLSFGINWIYLAAVIIALAMMLFGSNEAIEEKEVRMKIKIGKVLKVGLPSFLSGLLLLIVVGFYHSPRVVTQVQVPRPLFDSIIKAIPLPNIGANLLPMAQLDGLDKIDLNGIDLKDIESFFKNRGESIDFSDSSIDINELTRQLSIGSEKEQRDALYSFINRAIVDYTQTYDKYFAAGFAIALFFILKTLSVAFMWIVIFISWLIFKLLVALGAIKIQEKAVLQQVIEV